MFFFPAPWQLFPPYHWNVYSQSHDYSMLISQLTSVNCLWGVLFCRVFETTNLRKYAFVAVYQVEVTTQTGHYYRVERRYSAFHSLNKQCKKLGLGPLGEFPPKRIRNTSAKVLESRRKGLEYWIQSLARLHPLPQQLITFLELPSGKVSSIEHEYLILFYGGWWFRPY